MRKISLFLVAALFAFGANAATKYVKPGTGSTAWASKTQSDVYSTIADAITAAQAGDEIWVAQSTYTLTAVLSWKNGVNVYGGFVGNETAREQRSMDALLTIIARSGGTTRLLATTAALATPTTWSGFTFQNSGGGGVQMHANCILDNCVVRNNTRSNIGGGILADAGASTVIAADIIVQNCRIINNQASSSSKAGGGIYARADGTSTGKFILRNSVIANNLGTHNGGGIAIAGVPNEITYCTFAKNKMSGTGWPGGATYLNGTKTTIANCIFWGNEDSYAHPHPDIYIQPAVAGSSVKNCIVSRQITQGDGAAQNEYDIIDKSGDDSYVTVTNVTALTTPTTNDELKFISPSSTAGYSANSTENMNADWSIQSGSAAKDAGVAIAGLTTDITGRVRPKFAGVDAGAYEYVEHLTIQATENITTDYSATTMGDVVISATDASTGQWNASTKTITDGVIKVVKAVEANKVYVVGFPFVVNSISKPFATLKSYNGATNLFEEALSIEAGRGYLISFATAGDVTFTSVPNPTLLTVYPEASATYKLVPALSLKNETSIGGATKYYSYDVAAATWSGVVSSITGGIKPFEAVVVSTAIGNDYAKIGAGIADAKRAHVIVGGEEHVTVTQPQSGFPTYVAGLAGSNFQLKFTVGVGYELDKATLKTGVDPTEAKLTHTFADGVYAVTAENITDSITITLTTKKQEFSVAVSIPAGVTITAPAGSSPYAVFYDSTFVLKFTVSESEKYLPRVSIDGAATVVPPVEAGDVYAVTLPRAKANQTIAVSLAAKKTVTLQIDQSVEAGVVTITKPAGGAGAYVLPEGEAFTYAFTARNGYSVLVNGEAKTAGQDYSVIVGSKDTTFTITVEPATWKVTLNTNGTFTDITLTEAYPSGGYDVTHERSQAISFTVAEGKYPLVTPPKGVAYLLTKVGNVYTLTLPYVGDNLNVDLTAQAGVALPKGVVPVAEDVSSRGAGVATNSIYVINKGANNGNTYATHLKFDFSHLPLSTLQTFPSVQLKLNTGWQAGDAKGAQWLVTETEDTWSETQPFLISASPMPVDTIGTFTFGDIHPASPAENVDIYIDLTDYLKEWLSAPKRSTDKTLSLRIFNTLQSSNGGEVDLKSKEETGDVGPKLVFGSLNTAVSSLTVGGEAVALQSGVFAYTRPVELSAIGSKMPSVVYTLAEVSQHVLASQVTYSPVDTLIQRALPNTATFTVAPVDALKGEGVKRTYTVTFELPPVSLEIGATETKNPGSYTSEHGDIIFHVTDTSAAQLINSGALTVRGVVKVVRTFEANRFYTVGFPFNVTSSVTPQALFTYDGAQLQPATQIEKDKGYLIKFANAGEVTFTSTPNPTLPIASTAISQGDASYKFMANPYVNNISYVGNMITSFYYRYNSAGHYFEKVIANNVTPNPVKSFDGIIVSSNGAEQYILLEANSKLPHNVTYTASNGITVTSGQKATTVVQHDSAYVLTFTVDDCYEKLAATITNNSAYTLGAPDEKGVYTVKIDAVTQDTAINISVDIKKFDVTITKNTEVTIIEGADATLSCGTPYTVKFTVSGGTTPVATVNGKFYSLSAPVNGEYTILLTVNAAAAIDIKAATTRRVTVNLDNHVAFVSTSGQATATAGTYETADSNPFEVSFRLNTGYNSPQVTVGSAPYTLGAPSEGVYTVTVASVTQDTTISVTALLNSYNVTVNTNSVAQVTVPAQPPYKANHGEAFTLKFTLIGYYENPQVTVGGAPYTLGAPSEGVYTVTIASVTQDTAVSITASPKNFMVTVVPEHVTVTSPTTLPASVPYGSPLAITFTVNNNYENPQVTVGGVPYTLGAPSAGVYTVNIASVLQATTVSITASLKNFEVAVVSEHVTVTSPAALPASVPYGSSFALTFTVNEHYENPQVTVGGASYPLGDPNALDVYTVNITVAGNTTVSITASPKNCELYLTAGANITLEQPATAGAASAPYGSPFVVSFKVAAGYTPTVKTDGKEVTVGDPDAAGVYTVTAVPQVTGDHIVAITATKTATAIFKEDLSDPVVRVQYYTIAGVELSQPAITGVYIVKRTLASKKIVVRKELVIVR